LCAARTRQEIAAHREPADLAEESLAREVTRLLPPSESIYLVGSEADVYLQCGRRAPTPYFESCCATARQREEVVAELQRDLPGAVIVAPWVFPFQEDFQRLVETQLLPGRYVRLRTWQLPGRYFEPGSWRGLGRRVTQRTWVQEQYDLYLRADLARRAFPQGLPPVQETGVQTPTAEPRPTGILRWWLRVSGG
jgi:hypothetical protein